MLLFDFPHSAIRSSRRLRAIKRAVSSEHAVDIFNNDQVLGVIRLIEAVCSRRYPGRMGTSYQLQWAAKADYDDLADVMFEAVRRGPSRYTDRQRERWAPHRRSGEE